MKKIFLLISVISASFAQAHLACIGEENDGTNVLVSVRSPETGSSFSSAVVLIRDKKYNDLKSWEISKDQVANFFTDPDRVEGDNKRAIAGLVARDLTTDHLLAFISYNGKVWNGEIAEILRNTSNRRKYPGNTLKVLKQDGANPQYYVFHDVICKIDSDF